MRPSACKQFHDVMLTGTCVILCLNITSGAQVTLRDGASGSPVADGVQNDQQSVFARVRAYCAKLFPVTNALPVPPHIGANPAVAAADSHQSGIVEAADNHQSGTLDQQARGARQDAAMQPEAEKAFRASQSIRLAIGPEAHTSKSADVFNLFDSPDDMTGNDKV